MKTKPIRVLFAIAALAGAAFASGCGSSRASTASSALGVQDSAAQVAAVQMELDATVRSLNSLVNAPEADMQPQFAEFSDNLSRLDRSASDVRNASLQMQVRGQSYFQNWEQELSRMQSAPVREASSERRDEVFEQFRETAELYREANQELTQFVALLRDVRAHLATDLTPGGIAAVRGQVERINDRSDSVTGALVSVTDHFTDLGAAIPPQQIATSE